MDRRTMLKTAVATPFAALAVAAEATASANPLALMGRRLAEAVDVEMLRVKPALAALIDECDASYREFEAADAHIGQLYKLHPDRPPHPYVTPSEMGLEYQRRMLGYDKQKHLDSDGIDEYFDGVEHDIELSAPFNTPKANERMQREAVAERARMHALYRDRQAARDAWEEASGLSSALAKCDAASAFNIEMQDRVLDYPCNTIEEARMKADFFLRTWPDEDQACLAHRVLRSLLINA